VNPADSIEAESEVRLLAHIAELIGTSMPLEEVITSAIRLTSLVMGVDGSSILLVDRDSGALTFYAAVGEKADQLKNVTLAKGEGIAGFVAETGLPVVVSDVQRETRFSGRMDQMTGFKTRSIACVPLKVRGELTGVLEAVSRKSGSFGDKELDTLTAVAAPVAIMIENARLIEEVRGLHDKLAEASRVKGEYLATMTHELRTPINIVIGNLDLLLGGFVGEVSDKQRKCMETAMRNSGEALNLASGILDLSRFEAGQVAVRVEEFRLEEVWSELELLFRIGLSGKAVELIWEPQASLPPLKTDRIKLKTILSNIVFNSVKYTDRGSIRVSASLSEPEDRILIDVQDTGSGIPEEFLPLLFEPFRQAQGALTRSRGGVGLGLAIAKRMGNLLRGTIEVESMAGKGTTFHIQVPRCYSAD
jgi:signal transduction histidine kinase